MTTPSGRRPTRFARRLVVLAAAVALLATLAVAPAFADDGDDGMPVGVTVPPAQTQTDNISNAQLRWGLNRETGGGAYAGGCNFLSAGVASGAGGATAWTSGDGRYASHAGAVTIVRADGDGWTESSFDTKCLDSAGRPVSVTSTASVTQNQVVIDGGVGILNDSGLRIAWKGSFTVAFYGGMTYWSAADPVLSLDSAGNGTVTASLSGYGTSMEDQTKWVTIAPRSVVIARLDEVNIGASGGFSKVPDYLGVSVSGAGQSAKTADNAAFWGSFPTAFVDFQRLTGQTGYWLTTGGQRDAAKPATELIVNYDAAAPAVVPGVDTDPTSGSSAVDNPVRLRPPASVAPGATAKTSSFGVGASPASVGRAGLAALIPRSGADGFETVLLPLGGAMLALLISVLCVLQLAGKLAWPGVPRRQSR